MAEKYNCNWIVVILILILMLTFCNIVLVLTCYNMHRTFNSHQIKLNAITNYINNVTLTNINPYAKLHNNDDNNGESDALAQLLLLRSKRGLKRKKGKKSRRGRRKKDRCSKHEVIHLVVDSRSIDSGPLLTKGPQNVVDVWKLSDNSPQQSFATYHPNGTVTITKSALYMVYSQMSYFDHAGRWSHQVEVNHRPFIKCLSSEWGLQTNSQTGQFYNIAHQCYTSAVRYITRGSVVAIKSMYADRVIHEGEMTTFWGILKLS